MCPHFQGKEQWALLLCDMQSANRWLCCDCSLRSERYAATKRIPMNGLIQGCQRPAGLSSRSDRPETWPDLLGRTPGMSGRTTLPSSLCANTYMQYTTEAYPSVSTPSAQRLKTVSNPDMWEYNPEELVRFTPLRRFSSANTSAVCSHFKVHASKETVRR